MAKFPQNRRHGRMPKAKVTSKTGAKAANYNHPTADVLLRPDVGTQAQFKKAKPPKKYRYDSSLSPALDWDGKNPAREMGETAIREVHDGVAALEKSLDALKAAVGSLPAEVQSGTRKAMARLRDGASTLRGISKPFLNWAGKAERLSFDVP